jgi:sulfite reductase (ferredoxin)
MVVGAKALLLAKDIKCNTHNGIINDFDTHFVTTGEFVLPTPFSELVLQINKQEASEEFAKTYLESATAFVSEVIAFRKKQIGEDDDKQIIDRYYKA